MRSTRARGTAKPTGKPDKPGRKATGKGVSTVASAEAGRAPRTVTVTSTKAQNSFGDIVDRAARDAVVMITRHAKPRVVLLSYSS